MITSVMITLVMVDNHSCDGEFSSNDHCPFSNDDDHSGDEDHVGVDAPVAHCGPV